MLDNMSTRVAPNERLTLSKPCCAALVWQALSVDSCGMCNRMVNGIGHWYRQLLGILGRVAKPILFPQNNHGGEEVDEALRLKLWKSVRRNLEHVLLQCTGCTGHWGAWWGSEYTESAHAQSLDPSVLSVANTKKKKPNNKVRQLLENQLQISPSRSTQKVSQKNHTDSEVSNAKCYVLNGHFRNLNWRYPP